jgi:hypothetical protein
VSDHIVFVRFFLDYPEHFPFDRFVRLDDGAAEAAAAACLSEWEPPAADRPRKPRGVKIS